MLRGTDMCRTYGSGPGRYIRLCSRTGRRGERIVIGETGAAPGGCVTKAVREQLRSVPAKRLVACRPLRRPSVYAVPAAL